MDRRTFFKTLPCIAGVGIYSSCGIFPLASHFTPIKFGVVTDLHYAKRERAGTRYYEQTKYKLRETIKIFNQSDLDFVIELGDLKDIGENKEQTLSFLVEIENEFRKFQGPIYHVLGNHDMDNISKEDFFKHTENSGNTKGKAYYSFIRNRIKFIVLDANYNEDGTDYNCGNFDWTKAFIPDTQKIWLKEELNNSPYPIVLFVHQLLDSFSEIRKDVCIKNSMDIVEILETCDNVLAVFQGHHHDGHYSFRNGIHYVTIQGMIEGSFPDNNSFAIIEIDKKLNISIDGFYNCTDRFMEKKQ
jgi:alkaline phosphatase